MNCSMVGGNATGKESYGNNVRQRTRSGEDELSAPWKRSGRRRKESCCALTKLLTSARNIRMFLLFVTSGIVPESRILFSITMFTRGRSPKRQAGAVPLICVPVMPTKVAALMDDLFPSQNGAVAGIVPEIRFSEAYQKPIARQIP